LAWFLENYPELSIPERIPFKETMCIVAKHRPEYKIAEINDVLRYSLYLMGADPSLPHVPKKYKLTLGLVKRLIILNGENLILFLDQNVEKFVEE
jgi:hypothetical protein